MNYVLRLEMLFKKRNKNIVPQNIIDAFRGRISVLIEMYEDSRASKKSLQKSVDREVKRIKIVSGDMIPEEIKDLLDENGLKY